jgi:ferric-dicitrate binding protein FerR (iron transport regulator)
MSLPDHQFDDVQRHLDGTLDEAGVARLNAALAESAELRRVFAQCLRQRQQLAEVFESEAEKVTPMPVVRRRWLRPVALAAAALVMLAAGAALWWPRHVSPLRVSTVTGEVWVQRGAVKHRAAKGFALRHGDAVQTAFGAQAVLAWHGEATTLRLGEEATLTLPGHAGSAFVMEQGELTGDVAPRPVERQLVFQTPHGIARVLGTVFQLASEPQVMQLRVTEGRVALTSAREQRTVEVAAQQQGVVGEELPLAVRPVPVDGAGTGLLGEYFAGKQWDTPRLRRVDARVQFDWGEGIPVPHVHSDHFRVRWSGRLLPRYSGTHRVELVADDGVRLWVDGRLLIDQWDMRSRQTRMSGAVELEAGRAVDLRLEYYEASGKAFVSLYWHSDLQPREVIPACQLFPAVITKP